MKKYFTGVEEDTVALGVYLLISWGIFSAFLPA